MKNKIMVSIDLRIVCVLLLVIILAMIGIWKPWQASGGTDRTVTVTGTGKITAEPDYYQFSPSFQKATTAELNTQVNTVTAKLKELGVAEKDIQVQSSAYKSADSTSPMIAPAPEKDATYAYLTVKVASKELAQKVQDYIGTTGAQGQLTAYPFFF